MYCVLPNFRRNVLPFRLVSNFDLAAYPRGTKAAPKRYTPVPQRRKDGSISSESSGNLLLVHVAISENQSMGSFRRATFRKLCKTPVLALVCTTAAICWMLKLTTLKASLFVVTIAPPDLAVCTKFHKSPTVRGWCVPPVDGRTHLQPCSFKSWSTLLMHLGDLTLSDFYRDEFERAGRIGLQQKIESMRGNFLAHLRALKTMCDKVTHGGHPMFGIVMESDVDFSWSPAKVGFDKLGAIMQRYDAITSFNFGVTSPLCSQSHRKAGILADECFVPHRFGSWGTTAVGYNLSTACTRQFMFAQEQLIGCVPSDVALYSPVGGFQAMDASVPFFRVQTDVPSSNSGDAISQLLNRTYEDAERIWEDFSVVDSRCVVRNNRWTRESLDELVCS